MSEEIPGAGPAPRLEFVFEIRFEVFREMNTGREVRLSHIQELVEAFGTLIAPEVK